MTQYTTLVTGVSRGIGRAIADALIADGHTVIGLSRTPPDNTFRGIFHRVDLTDRTAAAEMLAAVTAEHQVDNLVNNAGGGFHAPIEEITLDQLDKTVALNLAQLIQCTQACLPAMKAKGRGRIVNIGSRAALGKAGQSVYGGSKSNVHGLTRTWALELGKHGITVNSIAPGPIATDLFRKNNPPESPRTKAIVNGILVGRMGEPEDIAGAASFLVSDRASFITGQTLFVDGGLTVGLSVI